MPTKHTIEEVFDLDEPYAPSPEVIAYGKELDKELGELDAGCGAMALGISEGLASHPSDWAQAAERIAEAYKGLETIEVKVDD